MALKPWVFLAMLLAASVTAIPTTPNPDVVTVTQNAKAFAPCSTLALQGKLTGKGKTFTSADSAVETAKTSLKAMVDKVSGQVEVADMQDRQYSVKKGNFDISSYAFDYDGGSSSCKDKVGLTQGFTLTLSDNVTALTILDMLVEAEEDGGYKFINFQCWPSVADRAAATKKAKQQAVNKALESAQDLAEATGRKLGRIVSINQERTFDDEMYSTPGFVSNFEDLDKSGTVEGGKLGIVSVGAVVTLQVELLPIDSAVQQAAV